MGWFPSWIGPARFGRPAFLGSVCEACAIADMVALAIQLSDAGAGDYWDDVDHYVRNQLVEQQSADRHLLLEVSAEGRPCQLAEGAETTTRDAIDRSLGAFSGFGEPTCLPASQFHGCCTGNGTQALYYAWEGVTRLRGDVIEVNLFLNRETSWIGVDSYLPHEGKVVLRTKRAATLAVHVPGWVDRARLTSHVDDRPLAPSWVGNFAMFPGVPLRALVTLEFPVPEQRAVYSAGGTTYTCVFRGSTLVDVSPRRASPASCPLYRRDHLRSPAASMRTARRFVAEKIIRW